MTTGCSKNPDFAGIFRRDAGWLFAALIRRLGNFTLAEESLQDAWVEALSAWPRQGQPDNTRAWLITVARRRAIDRLRRKATRESSAGQLKALYELESTWSDVPESVEDDRLRLVFTCCHPALAEEHQVALTLNTVCGLDVNECARAFLVKPTTMAQRLVRAKRKIREAGIPFSIPEASQLAGRLDAVRKVIYLMFNEGYQSTSGDALVRQGLSNEAIRLGGLLRHEMTGCETCGLLALMLMSDARRPARCDGSGDFIPLEKQDRSLWNQDKIKAGKAILLKALGQRKPGPYQVQAAISATHNQAAQFEDTDWADIAGLYAALEQMTPSPVVTLNRAVAVAYAKSPQAGLDILKPLADRLKDYQPYHASMADLLRRCGQLEQSVSCYRTAIRLCQNTGQRRFLESRLQTLSGAE